MKQFLQRCLRSLLVSSVILSAASAQDGGDVFQKYEPDVRKAVNRGLDYLLSVEQSDGTFPEAHGRSTGISSLVGMALLSTGATPGNGRYGEAINRRIDYALRHVDKDGVISCGDHGNGPMYAHNIATLFISECSGMVDAERQKKIDALLPKAIKILLTAQAVKKDSRNQGGWRYHPNSNDSDMSCSGWALMGLRSARLNGAAVPSSAIESAVGYVRRMQSPKLGHIGYTSENERQSGGMDPGKLHQTAQGGVRVLRQLLQCAGDVPVRRQVLEDLRRLDVYKLPAATKGGRLLGRRALW
jgi:hypothetical protein